MKKIKLLTGFLATTPLVASITTITSCSKDQLDTIARDIVKQAYQEFLKIAEVPRPSYHTHNIREYLINRFTELGYSPKTDLVGTDTQEASQHANIWVDIPASKGYENYKKLIIQGHMDMIVAGLGKSDDPATWTTPIEVEYHEDGNYLTSKDKKTSLGTDDGIGLGLIFALLQNSSIKHGPLRVLITSDEEVGMEGAKALKANHPEVITEYDGLLSVDGELMQEGYYRSCAGAVQNDYGANWPSVDITNGWTVFDIYVEGFKGGHSGNDINKNRANADVFMNWVLSELNPALSDQNVQIIEYNHKNSKGVDANPGSTSIPALGRYIIATNKTATQINAAFEETKSWFKTKYDGEEWDKVTIDVKEVTTSIPTKALSADNSRAIISLISNCDDDKVGFMYGYIPEITTNKPILSCNISPLSIKQVTESSTTTTQFNVSTNGRSVATNGMILLTELWKSIFYSHIPSTSGTLVEKYCINPWEPNDEDPLQKLSNAGYKNINIDPYIRDTDGCVEPAIFGEIKPTLEQACVGTKLVDVHTVNETCYLEPLVNTVKVIKYIFENYKN